MVWKNGRLNLSYDIRIIDIGFSSTKSNYQIIKSRIEEVVTKIAMLKDKYDISDIINEISTDI
jgi:hypothetical protein